MEHATEAFMMAFGVFTLVIALSISISLLGQVNACSTSILGNVDRQNEYLYIENAAKQRTVGIETIIPTIYRAYDEIYRIEFYNANKTPYKLYEKDGNIINKIDLEKENWEDHEEFLKDLIYGDDGTGKNNYTNLKIKFDTITLYEKLKNLQNNNKKITEYLGEYYIEDSGTSGVNSGMEDINKTKKRVIVYVVGN